MCSKALQRSAALLFSFVFFVCGVSVMVAAAFVVSDEVGKLSGRHIDGPDRHRRADRDCECSRRAGLVVKRPE